MTFLCVLVCFYFKKKKRFWIVLGVHSESEGFIFFNGERFKCSRSYKHSYPSYCGVDSFSMPIHFRDI